MRMLGWTTHHGVWTMDHRPWIPELILEMNKEFGTAFIIVTHDMALAERIGSVYRLHDGCLTAVDTI